MENETLPPSGQKAGDQEFGLPKTSAFGQRPSGPAASAAEPVGTTSPGAVTLAEPVERGGIFGRLVKDDADIAGLVAYSIYKQNKLDWSRAFETAKGRPPNESELSAYIIGEGTARRIATYRHLAEATLAGNGPDVDAKGAASTSPIRRRLGPADTKMLTNGLMITYGLIAILFVIVLWFAAHFSSGTH